MNEPEAPQPEARFTAPTGLCPHPERWTSTDDDSAECEVSEFLGSLVRALQPDACIETGAAWGNTSRLIGEALQANGRGWLAALELDTERCAYARNICDGLPVDIVEGSSLDYLPGLDVVEFAFFDSLFDLRVAEFIRFRPWMREGTIVAFHDTAPHHGMMPSGRDLRGDIEADLGTLLRVIHLPTPRGLTIGEVLALPDTPAAP